MKWLLIFHNLNVSIEYHCFLFSSWIPLGIIDFSRMSTFLNHLNLYFLLQNHTHLQRVCAPRGELIINSKSQAASSTYTRTFLLPRDGSRGEACQDNGSHGCSDRRKRFVIAQCFVTHAPILSLSLSSISNDYACD